MKKTAGSGSISQTHGSADPDPRHNVMDPEHCTESALVLFAVRMTFRQAGRRATPTVTPHMGDPTSLKQWTRKGRLEKLS